MIRRTYSMLASSLLRHEESHNREPGSERVLPDSGAVHASWVNQGKEVLLHGSPAIKIAPWCGKTKGVEYDRTAVSNGARRTCICYEQSSWCLPESKVMGN